MHILSAIIIIGSIGAGAWGSAQAQPANACKQCSEQRRACMSGYSGKTCQTEYERCMKNCKAK